MTAGGPFPTQDPEAGCAAGQAVWGLPSQCVMPPGSAIVCTKPAERSRGSLGSKGDTNRRNRCILSWVGERAESAPSQPLSVFLEQSLVASRRAGGAEPGTHPWPVPEVRSRLWHELIVTALSPVSAPSQPQRHRPGVSHLGICGTRNDTHGGERGM